MQRIAVGVDAGKRTHRVAAYDPAAGTVVGQGSFPVSRDGFEQLVLFLHHHASDQAEVLVGIEATGHYHVTLVEFLLERGYAVVLVNPYQAAQFRRSQGAKAKTDRIDARALARFVAVSGLRAVSPTDARLVGLRESTRFRADLVGQRTTALNTLQAALDLAFPELLTIFKQPGSRTVLGVDKFRRRYGRVASRGARRPPPVSSPSLPGRDHQPCCLAVLPVHLSHR